MFEKWTKKVASKATDGAVTGVKETLNDKLETYSGIIKIGLTLGVIIFGSNHIANRNTLQPPVNRGYSPPQQPIIINNYISDGRSGNYGGPKQNHQKR